MSPPLYLEDFSVGQTFVSGTHALDASQIKAFASQFDPQPFHLDEAAAARSFFGGLAASGWHTASLTMRLLVGSGLNVDGGLIGAGCELRWLRPTRPDDILQVFTEVIAVKPPRPGSEQGLISLRSETRNQQGSVLQIMTSALVAPARPI